MGAALWQTLAAYRLGASELIAEAERSRLSVLAVFARDTLLTRDYATLQAHLEALAEGPDVTVALLLDDHGTVVASSEPAMIGAPAEADDRGDRHWRTLEVVHGTRTGGAVAIEFSSAQQDALDAAMRRQALFAGLAGTLLCAGISVLAAHLLLRRLRPIVDAARRVGEGDLDARVGAAGGDEIGTLARVFDQMVEQLSQTAQELRAHRVDLERLVEERTTELRAAQQSLLERERLSALGELTASVSHELRNPLGTIQASLYRLRSEESALSPQARRAAERAERSIARCVRILDDLADYSETRELRPTRFVLGELVTTVAERFESVKLLDEAGPDACLLADRELIEKALFQILRNAVQASSENTSSEDTSSEDDGASPGEVLVRTERGAGLASVVVRDRGPGIPEAELRDVFTPLYSTRAFGAGLGLPIAREIADRHGGTLSIDSGPGEGTRVSLQLPLDPSGTPAP